MFLLEHLASPYHRESLSGDLIEQYQSGRSMWWFWRQVLSAILAARMRDIAANNWPSLAKSILRIVNAIMLAAALALGVGSLTRADSPQQICTPQAHC